jgi:hypothetical protein
MSGRLREARHAALMGLAVLMPAQFAWSDPGARSDIAVTAQVATVTRIVGIQQPAVVTISPDDAARGYVTAQATVRVRSNAIGGYVLTLWPRAPWFDSVRVVGAGATTQLPGDGGSISRPALRSAVDEMSLELTFRLRDGVPEGAYAWPVEFEVSPL